MAISFPPLVFKQPLWKEKMGQLINLLCQALNLQKGMGRLIPPYLFSYTGRA